MFITAYTAGNWLFAANKFTLDGINHVIEFVQAIVLC